MKTLRDAINQALNTDPTADAERLELAVREYLAIEAMRAYTCTGISAELQQEIENARNIAYLYPVN